MNYDKEKGFVYYTKNGVLEGSFEMFSARNFYKRIYYLFDKYRGENPYILGHSFPISPYASFFDICFYGEYFKPKKEYEYTEYFLQKSVLCTPVAPPPKTEKNYDAICARCFFNKCTKASYCKKVNKEVYL